MREKLFDELLQSVQECIDMLSSKVEDINESEDTCERPCPPFVTCDECAEYWQRMRDEGYWEDSSGWTDKGWREIMK